MAGPCIPKNDLNENVLQLGELVGLLEVEKDSVCLVGSWFESPGEEIRKIPDRPQFLFPLIKKFMGAAIQDPPRETAAAWYPIMKGDKPSGVFVLLPEGVDDEKAKIGLGLLHDIPIEKPAAGPSNETKKIRIWAASELFELDPAEILVGKEPVSFAVEIEGDYGTGDNTFAGVGVVLNVFLDGSTKPELGVVIRDLKIRGRNHGDKKFSNWPEDLERPLIDDINVMLATGPVEAWLKKSLPGGKTLDTVLMDFGLLGQVDPPKLGDIPTLKKLTAEGFVERLMAAVAGSTLVTFENGSLEVVETTVGAETLYGIRLQVADIPLGKNDDESDAKRRFLLQLGSWLDDDGDHWIKKASGPDTTDNGVFLYLVSVTGDREEPGAIAFSPELSLVSLGLDAEGVDENQLIEVGGFKLGAFKPRFYLDVDFTDTSKTVWGVGARANEIAIPLSAGLDGAEGNDSNPVANNLLASGDGGKEAVNPAFSFLSAYVEGGEFALVLYDAEGKAAESNLVWLPMQRSIGQLSVQKVGVQWLAESQHLALLLNAGVKLAALELGLDKLSVEIPVTAPTDLGSYTLDLAGIAAELHSGALDLTGGLLKTEDPPPVGYAGEVIIKLASKFSMMALGGYSEVDNSPSLFVFVLLDAPLGDPTGTGGFFVTGLAGGFGYNRNLLSPTDTKDVQKFPLVAGALPGQKVFPKDVQPQEALAALQEYIPPKRGQNWLAAGVRFTSWELMESFALVTVTFGTKFEIGLLGISSIQIPVGKPIAQANLALRVVVDPGEGLFEAGAALTSGSYLMSKDCQLTGGFATTLWLPPNQYAGQFVVTLGGYAPSFKPPENGPKFPSVERVGINWPVTKKLEVTGGLYFALTPSCIMAGGSLSANYKKDNLKAEFDAWVNFLAEWKPFHYEFDVGIGVDVSYKADAGFLGSHTFSTSLDADLELYGPPFGGEAEISWTVISFTISFGADATDPRPVTWEEFRQEFLPADQGAESGICHARPTQGLLRTVEDPEQGTWWILDPHNLLIETSSLIPASKLTFNSEDIPLGTGVTTSLGVRPMKEKLTATHALTLVPKEEEKEEEEESYFDFTPILRDVPAALWADDFEKLKQPSAEVVPECFVGTEMRVRRPDADEFHVVPPASSALAMELADLLVNSETSDYEWQGPPPTGPLFPQKDAVEQIACTIESPQVDPKRQGILEALVAQRLDVVTDVDLSVFVKLAAEGEVFRQEPVLVGLGVVDPNQEVART